MRIFIVAIFLVFSPNLWAQNLVKDCSVTLLSTKSFAVDCDLAKLQLFEARKIENDVILGRATYTVLFRFVVKNPGNFSRLVLNKPVAGAVEECIIQNMYDVGAVALILQSPLPYSGSTMLIDRVRACMKTILSQELLDKIIEDYDLWVKKDGWASIRTIKSDD